MSEGPIEPKHHAVMNALAKGIDNALNGKDTPKADKKVGFFLGVFNFGDIDAARFNYISNANRDDIIVLLKEMRAKFEGQPDIEGHA
jgi:hypothetical protein